MEPQFLAIYPINVLFSTLLDRTDVSFALFSSFFS